jgi:ribonuclease HI
MAVVEIYTDGSARGNPGPGGYGAILKYGKHEKELSQGYRRTTNNRMELLAVIVALESLTKEGLDVDIYSDSKYVVEAVNQKWVFGWQKKGFKGKKNPDLWQRFLKIYPKHHIKFHWIKGHNEHPYNERCDVLATTAADGRNLIVDHGFEAQSASGENLL